MNKFCIVSKNDLYQIIEHKIDSLFPPEAPHQYMCMAWKYVSHVFHHVPNTFQLKCHLETESSLCIEVLDEDGKPCVRNMVDLTENEMAMYGDLDTSQAPSVVLILLPPVLPCDETLTEKNDDDAN